MRFGGKLQAGFTLLEAALGGVILIMGITALIQVSASFMRQITDIHATEGQPAIEERLVHDEIALICSPGNTVAYPGIPPLVPPLVSDGTTYSVSVAAVSPGGQWPTHVYSIQAQVFHGNASAPVYFNKGQYLCF